MTTGMRQPTAYKGEVPMNLGPAANINLVNRPVTQQGLTGIKTSAQGPKRTVYDRTYYLNQLKQKSYEIAAEIQMFRKRNEEVDKEQNLYGQLENKFQEIRKEVLSLEGTLADFNLAADRQRSRAKPEEIRGSYLQLKSMNERFRHELDEMFIERKRQEDEIKELEQEVREMEDSATSKIAELTPEQRKEYDVLAAEKALVVADLSRCKMELEELENKVEDQDKKLRMDQNRIRVIELKQQIAELEAKRIDLEVQCDEQNMSVSELVERIFQKIKSTNQTIAEIEARTRELKKAIDNNRKLKEMESEITGGTQVTEESKQKYEALFAKEQQLDKFIESFPRTRQKEFDDMTQKQQQILQYLDNISQSINLIRHAPDPEMVERVRSDYQNRQRNMQNSEATLELVQNQYQTRLQDLEKIKNLQETAPQKIQLLKDRISSMKADMQKFKNAEEVRSEMFEKRKRLIEKTRKLQQLDNEYRKKLADQEENFKRAKQNLSAHQKYAGFMEMEKKISQAEQVINNWKNMIATRSQEIDPEPQSSICRGIAQEINKLLCKA